ncbi:hypothetical protein JZG80_07280 [Staphylococcus saprophyticus]|uniref:hypothetical protein n=1 Tax=Staphylococcus saprophyticus TaxID=29385 RepID=UPI001013C50B|nr:hypothetical protein [Staphylococcus saprophyticus]MBN6092375.1 hypothetical protein [Staphylococcus saprophyticus]MDW4312491.1 hypothetical protein [Staphylococcus saprophyticus]MDW4371580.1 hypothetical protein [Staphylococcus saprophyticus]RXS01972.1 hypothetical protein EUA49_10515 [Staphylococcus saprophyticus]
MTIIIDNQPVLEYGTYEPPVIYEIKEEVSDYELLTRFNPYFISEKISAVENDIEMMYERTYPHLASDEFLQQIYYESFPLETLAIEIIEQKEKLEAYTRKSRRELKMFYKVINKYSINEQNDIKRFMKSHGAYNPDIVDILKQQLYKASQNQRDQRKDEYKRQRELKKQAFVKQNKQQDRSFKKNEGLEGGVAR